MKKVCSVCGRELDESNFHKNKNSKDGLAYMCKDCAKKCRKGGLKTEQSILKQVNKELATKGLKRCNECGEILPLDEFYNSHSRCRRCESKTEAQRILDKQRKKKEQVVRDACEEVNVKPTDDIIKVGVHILSNKRRKVFTDKQD